MSHCKHMKTTKKQYNGESVCFLWGVSLKYVFKITAAGGEDGVPTSIFIGLRNATPHIQLGGARPITTTLEPIQYAEQRTGSFTWTERNIRENNQILTRDETWRGLFGLTVFLSLWLLFLFMMWSYDHLSFCSFNDAGFYSKKRKERKKSVAI